MTPAMARSMKLLEERVDMLAGTRGAVSDKGRRAIRVLDVADLAKLKATSAPAAADPPTKAEFDALVSDVATIIAALVLLGSAG